MSDIIPVILSGGSGTRLWPLSRRQRPKQYLSLFEGQTLLQETILRLKGLNNLLDPIIVCNSDHRFLVADQLKQLGVENPTIILEPMGRNTAPAICAAAYQAIKDLNEDAILLVLSADHVIKDVEAFHNSIEIAIKQAINGKIAIFGVVPDSPNTGYGYIKLSDSIDDKTYGVEKFIEKPDLESTTSYVNEGGYLWNSGMFLFNANVLINELSCYAPEIVNAVKGSVDNAHIDIDFIRLNKKSFQLSPSDSIDYALMERSKNVVVISLQAGWSDIGTWLALYESMQKNKDNNVILGDVFTQDTTGSYINASHHLVATIGIKDLIIVDTPDATLIASKNEASKIKKILDQLEGLDRSERDVHRKVFRPWGWYDCIESGPLFQVKRLNINPEAKLSLQLHHKRAEHWVVVRGIASAIIGNELITLKAGESTYIPIGVKHSLENNTINPLEIIEVQSGEYLGEDDIVRFEDIYGRIEE